MPATLTEQEFSKHLKTNFRVNSENPFELQLTEVKGYAKENEQSGMERFSIFFLGPENRFLPQGVYSLEHERMGALEIFLVPIARGEGSLHYEAVFNYFKQQETT